MGGLLGTDGISIAFSPSRYVCACMCMCVVCVIVFSVVQGLGNEGRWGFPAGARDEQEFQPSVYDDKNVILGRKMSCHLGISV